MPIKFIGTGNGIIPKILLSKTTRYKIILHSGCVNDSLKHGLSLYTSNFKTRS
ncbi:hypothetical protein [Methanobacterium spitsbergense]|uniref:Uncharacterized protein n=1 Tax=Methanobacterium spitsbergense TaxID=2874285 RepID=A0A8T5V499_9EURY|nr:hypothetical protein [Methanobacterium spitsbergense]MBZ2166711.1 hypothetical protein [Methanobacterium spitsbergense]